MVDLHADEILHRDIKPSNIMILGHRGQPLRAVLADFGLATAIQPQEHLTKTHEGVGTPPYRAPEANYRGTNEVTDVYSLGRTLEFILTRRSPSPPECSLCPRDRGFSEDLCSTLDHVVAKACSPHAADRYQSVQSLVDDLPQTHLDLADRRQLQRKRAISDFEYEGATVMATVMGECLTPDAGVLVTRVRNATTLTNFRNDDGAQATHISETAVNSSRGG
jgi:serine/threonine protein kinase